MSRHGQHYMSARSVSTKDLDDPESGGDRKSNDRNIVPKTVGHGRNVQETPGYRGKYSKHLQDDLHSGNELGGMPKDTEYISSDPDDSQSWSQESLLSSDRSKSYSQICSEILEESKERQEKAERAFRVYHINRSKLRRSHQQSLSRGPGSGSSMASEYSSKSGAGYHDYDSPSTDPSREPVLKTHCRSDIPTTATSQSRSQRDYLSSCSTRHRHHPHYHRQRSVPKTYQDRGNSPINIKTRRRTHDNQEPHSAFGSEKAKAVQVGRSSASIGVQYPSQDETADWTDWTPDTTHGDRQLKSRNGNCSRSSEKKRDISDEQRPITIRDTHAKDVDIPVSFGSFSMKKHLSVITEVASEHHEDPDQDMIDSELSNPVALETYDESEQYAYDYEYSYEPEIIKNNEFVSDDSDPRVSSQEGYHIDQEDYVIDKQEMSHGGGSDASSSEVAKSKSFLSLKIYDADEALMEIPEDFEGPAIVLDDDADFLDITLTDDEEKIRAKLMAAALTTRKSTSSISPNSSSLRNRPPTEPISLSYKPNVIFTRRSEVIEDNYAPRPNDRVALLAEKFLQSFSESATNDYGWKPSEQEVTSADSISQLFNENGVTKSGGDTPLCGDRQLLSVEFNRKLQRQLKVIVESFQ
ncbi:GM10671 [Drosophila sechellia]|uniref:GM10671 n=1 Tax=Drosophila sechellia TaxID=7238 RepID=B4I3U4_DROSE|nr:GM10671 [Drosophila sechellia]